MRSLFLSLLFLLPISAEIFLNSTKEDFKKCGMNTTLCDPNKVLSKEERLLVESELLAFERKTSILGGKGGCVHSGISPAVYLVENEEQEPIDEVMGVMRSGWKKGGQCGNKLLLVLSTLFPFRHRVILSPDQFHPPLNVADVSHYIQREYARLSVGNYSAAIVNVLKKSAERVTAKHQFWTPASLPNPLAGGHEECRMEGPEPFCDPDGVLDEEERKSIAHALHQFYNLTVGSPVSSEHNTTECEEEGISMGIVLVRHVKGEDANRAREMALFADNLWFGKEPCGKHMVMVLVADEKKVGFGAPASSPIELRVINYYVGYSAFQFLQEDYHSAIGDILRRTVVAVQTGQLYEKWTQAKPT